MIDTWNEQEKIENDYAIHEIKIKDLLNKKERKNYKKFLNELNKLSK